MELLTSHQLRVVCAFNRFKDSLLPSKLIRTIHRVEGHNISLGLALNKGDQHYIVRQTVQWHASEATIQSTAVRLVDELGRLYNKMVAYENNQIDNV